MHAILLPLLAHLLLFAATWPDTGVGSLAAPPVYTFQIVRVFPHDARAFTQGLVFVDGELYESTGGWGASSLRRVDLTSGVVLQRIDLPGEVFGEGLAARGRNLVQITWTSQIGYVYDRDTFLPVGTFGYPQPPANAPLEGWGLTYDGEHLIVSDGSDTLYFWDPYTFQEVRRVRVYDNQGPVRQLNELEMIGEELCANIWFSDRIACIDPGSGGVTRWIDLTGLLPAHDRTPTVDVLNGIAYDPAGDRLFVTGKNWPKLFQIELMPRPIPRIYLPMLTIRNEAW